MSERNAIVPCLLRVSRISGLMVFLGSLLLPDSGSPRKYLSQIEWKKDSSDEEEEEEQNMGAALTLEDAERQLVGSGREVALLAERIDRLQQDRLYGLGEEGFEEAEQMRAERFRKQKERRKEITLEDGSSFPIPSFYFEN